MILKLPDLSSIHYNSKQSLVTMLLKKMNAFYRKRLMSQFLSQCPITVKLFQLLFADQLLTRLLYTSYSAKDKAWKHLSWMMV